MGSPRARSRISADGLTYRFALRPEARFHDGSPLTAHDVAFSLTTLKEKGHPIITQLLRDFAGCEATDDATVIVRFAPKRARDVPLFVAGLPIFSRAYYGKRPFEESTLDIPLGSGPYQVGRFEAGRYIEYKRVPDWWGADLPVAARPEQLRQRALRILPRPRRRLRGLHRQELSVPRGVHLAHLGDALRLSRRSRMAASSATCCPTTRRRARRAGSSTPGGRNSAIRSSARRWAAPSISSGPTRTSCIGSYDRTHSVFQNSDMMANGKPGAEELALLEPFRGKVSDEVFGEPFVPPVSDGSGQDRALLRRASQLLQEAGYVIKDGKRVSPKGERLGDRIPAR